MAGREVGEVRKRFFGNPEIAVRFMGPARLLLGQLKEDMGYNALQQGVRRAVIPIDERIQYGPSGSKVEEAPSPNNDWILNPTGAASENTEEYVEHHVTGKVLLSAISVHGQDEVRIDARAVVIREERKVQRAAPEYFPYLWVGICTEGGGTVAPYTGSGDPAEAFRHIGLHVFEPLNDEELAAIVGSYQHGNGYRYYAGSASNGLYLDNARSNYLEIGPLAGQFPQDVPFDYQQPNRIWYTDHNLYYMGHGVAGSLAPDRNSPNARLWQKAVCLDPEDPKKTLNATGPFNYANRSYGGYALSGTEWQLRGKVKGGKYLVKLNAWYGPTCAWHAGPEFDVIIKIIVGKPPGRQTVQTIRLTFPRNQWSEFSRDIWPNADPQAPDPGSFYQNPGPNPHAAMWWQGAIEVDVQLGTIAESAQVTIPPWGFVPASPQPQKEICWRGQVTLGIEAGGIVTNFEYGGGSLSCVNANPHEYRMRASFLARATGQPHGTLVSSISCQTIPPAAPGSQTPLTEWGPWHPCAEYPLRGIYFTRETGFSWGSFDSDEIVCGIGSILGGTAAGLCRFPEGFEPQSGSVPDGETLVIGDPGCSFKSSCESDCGGETSASGWHLEFP